MAPEEPSKVYSSTKSIFVTRPASTVISYTVQRVPGVPGAISKVIDEDKPLPGAIMFGSSTTNTWALEFAIAEELVLLRLLKS